MGTSSVAGDPAWGSFGHPAERAAVDGWVIITAPRTGRGDSAAEECPCLLLRCRRDPGKQPGPMAPLDAGLLTGGGERGARIPRLRLAPPHQKPWAQAGQWGGQSWDAGSQLELAGWVPCRAVLCHASPAWWCQRGTGMLCSWHRRHPGRHNPKPMAPPSSANTPRGSAPFWGAPHWSGLSWRALPCPAPTAAEL